MHAIRYRQRRITDAEIVPTIAEPAIPSTEPLSQ
jgi:hypothetical protein